MTRNSVSNPFSFVEGVAPKSGVHQHTRLGASILLWPLCCFCLTVVLMDMACCTHSPLHRLVHGKILRLTMDTVSNMAVYSCD
jgi:hypothetical protein